MKQTILFSMPDLTIYQEEFTILLQQNMDTIKTLLTINPPTWDTVVHPLAELSNKLHMKWSTLAHLHNVQDTEEVRLVYNACLPLLSDYQSQLGQNTALYLTFKNIAESANFSTLSAEQQKVIKDNLRDFHLSGVDLNEQDKATFRLLEQQHSELTTIFEEHLLDATHAWKKEITDINLLAGVPEHALSYAKAQAEEKNLSGWLLSLEIPCYLAVLSYADNRALRQEMYEAFITRASELGNPAFDNSKVMQDILSTRFQLANLLSFNNYAQLSLATKMLKKPEQVLQFLNQLATLALPSAKKEIATLEEYAKKIDHLTQLEPWDLAYYSEKLQKELFDFNSEELRPYFPETQVLTGLFSLVADLYGIEIIALPITEKLWDKEVKCFAIKNSDKEIIGHFYMDLYARPAKHGGAWMDDFASRYKTLAGDLQLPVAFLNCNFTAPTANRPSLLTHDEVITLFHEFGHGLHHLLTQMDILDISGISGVEWDAVELPSQLMENFCWEKSVLDKIAKHYQTGEPLSETLYQQLLASKNFQSAMQLLRQVEFALFDFNIHLYFDADTQTDFIQNTLDAVREKVAVVPIKANNRFQHSFSHIFAGGYAAGYYSYKWAEVLSCDVYELFAQNNVISAEVGKHFLTSLLSRGGSEEAMTLFKAFRGREPDLNALLRHAGLEPVALK